MNKIVVLFLLMMGFSQARAQRDLIPGNFKFGFQASPTVSWMNTADKDISGNGINLGFRLGLLGEYYFRENYAITSGIGFTFNQGGKLLYAKGGNYLPKSDLSDSKLNTGAMPLPDNTNIRYHVQYLEIPLGLKLKTQDFGYIRYFAEPNISLSIRTQARGDISGGVNSSQENIKGDVNFLNLSWGIGGGIHYSVNESTSIQAGLYFNKYFGDVTKDSGNKAVRDDLGNNDPNDDVFVTTKDVSKATIGSLTFRVAVFF